MLNYAFHDWRPGLLFVNAENLALINEARTLVN